MIGKLWMLICDDEAATAVEYAVLLALILMGVIGAIGMFGSQTNGLWGNIDGQLEGTKFGQLGGP